MKPLTLLFSPANRTLWIAGAASFFASALANAPASLGAAIATRNAPLLEISGAKGTIWRGQIKDVVYNRILIGDVAWRLDPLGLLTGRLVADATSEGGALNAKGRVSISPTTIEIRNATALFNLSAIRQYTFFGARYQGSARLAAKSLALSKTGCRAEGASVSTDALDTLAKQWSGAALPLAGDVGCDGGKLNLTLAGKGEDGAVRIEVSVAPDLAYTMTFMAEPRRDEVSRTLRLFGFEGDGDRLSWRAVGQLKGLSS